MWIFMTIQGLKNPFSMSSIHSLTKSVFSTAQFILRLKEMILKLWLCKPRMKFESFVKLHEVAYLLTYSTE